MLYNHYANMKIYYKTFVFLYLILIATSISNVITTNLFTNVFAQLKNKFKVKTKCFNIKYKHNKPTIKRL